MKINFKISTMKTTLNILFPLLLTITYSCHKPTDTQENLEIIDENPNILSIIIGDTIGEAGFEYYDGDSLELITCTGGPDDYGKGIDFDHDGEVDLCFWREDYYWQDWPDWMEVHLQGIQCYSENLTLLHNDSSELITDFEPITVGCADNFLYNEYYYLCSDVTTPSTDPENYSPSGFFCDGDDKYLIFKLEGENAIGLGWIHLKQHSSSNYPFYISGFGFQPNVDC